MLSSELFMKHIIHVLKRRKKKHQILLVTRLKCVLHKKSTNTGCTKKHHNLYKWFQIPFFLEILEFRCSHCCWRIPQQR